jgi:outer membrane lipoprotein-sorting protein
MVKTMNAKLVFAAISVLLLLVACGQKTAMPETKPAPIAPAPAAPVTAQAPETAVNDIESSSAEVEQLTQEFDTSGLDTLDQDLATIDSLDFG